MAALAAGASTAVICFILNAVVFPFTTISGVKKAEAEGRVVRARFVKILVPYGRVNFDQGVGSTVDVIYTYEYKGRTYQYRGAFAYNEQPALEQTLYFRKDPSKARPAHQFGKMESEWVTVLIVMLVVSFIATFFLF